MRKIKSIKIDDREVTIKELNVREVREVMEGCGLKADATLVIDLMFQDRLPVAAVLKATDLSADSLDDMTQSELDTIYTAVEELNPFFVRLYRDLAAVGDSLPSIEPSAV